MSEADELAKKQWEERITSPMTVTIGGKPIEDLSLEQIKEMGKNYVEPDDEDE
jgi:hypothetical protein